MQKKNGRQGMAVSRVKRPEACPKCGDRPSGCCRFAAAIDALAASDALAARSRALPGPYSQTVEECLAATSMLTGIPRERLEVLSDGHNGTVRIGVRE